jgi:hypothetical protein
MNVTDFPASPPLFFRYPPITPVNRITGIPYMAYPGLKRMDYQGITISAPGRYAGKGEEKQNWRERFCIRPYKF